jgi:hypothetical protein
LNCKLLQINQSNWYLRTVPHVLHVNPFYLLCKRITCPDRFSFVVMMFQSYFRWLCFLLVLYEVKAFYGNGRDPISRVVIEGSERTFDILHKNSWFVDLEMPSKIVYGNNGNLSQVDTPKALLQQRLEPISVLWILNLQYGLPKTGLSQIFSKAYWPNKQSVRFLIILPDFMESPEWMDELRKGLAPFSAEFFLLNPKTPSLHKLRAADEPWLERITDQEASTFHTTEDIASVAAERNLKGIHVSVFDRRSLVTSVGSPCSTIPIHS